MVPWRQTIIAPSFMFPPKQGDVFKEADIRRLSVGDRIALWRIVQALVQQQGGESQPALPESQLQGMPTGEFGPVQHEPVEPPRAMALTMKGNYTYLTIIVRSEELVRVLEYAHASRINRCNKSIITKKVKFVSDEYYNYTSPHWNQENNILSEAGANPGFFRGGATRYLPGAPASASEASRKILQLWTGNYPF